MPRGEQLRAPRAEPALEAGEEVDGLGGEDALGARHSETLDLLALDDYELVRGDVREASLGAVGEANEQLGDLRRGSEPKWARGSSDDR